MTFIKGQIPWNKNKKGIMPIPWNKDKPYSEAIRRKCGLKNKGKHRSPKTEFKKGQTSWNKNKKRWWKSSTEIKKGEHRGIKTEFRKGDKRISGKNHHSWRDGITPLLNKVRNTFEYRQWRSDVFMRDNFTCQECGNNRGGNLEAHHIDKLADILFRNHIKTLEGARNCEELWNINNGRTLCLICHSKTDNFGKKHEK